MFRMLRYFSIASLLSILIAAVLLTAFYRRVASDDIIHLGETNNIALSQVELNALRFDLVEYLNAVTRRGGNKADPLPPSGELRNALHNMMTKTAVVRIKLYSRDGIVVFSTDQIETGRDQRDNLGFVSAMKGNITSQLVYRDTFNLFDHITSEDNLVHTYIPVRETPGSPIAGVFEIYTDANPLVDRAEHTELIILIGAAAIFLLLYVALLLIVKRADRIIEGQQRTIQERTAMLETLSAQRLAGEEDEKKRIAAELHEGIAQTLAAIKLKVETTCRLLEGAHPRNESAALEKLVPLIQGAIRDVRELAMELRPSGLDDHGLLPTLAWLCREFQAIHPELRIEQHIQLSETDIPGPLKVIIYRITKEALHEIARHPSASQVRLRLEKTDHAIELAIGCRPVAGAACNAPDKAIGMATLRERAVLSGGSFAVEEGPDGGATIHTTWRQ